MLDVSTLWSLQGQLLLLIAAGALVRRLKLIDEEGQAALTNVVLYVTLPCSILLSFMMEVDHSLLSHLLVVFLLSAGVQVFSFTLSKLHYRNVEESKRNVLRYGLLVSNAGFMGLPIAGLLFGQLGYIYASIYLIPQRVVMWSAGLALFGDRNQSFGVRMKQVAVHPCMIAVYLGFLLMFTSLALPSFVTKTLASLGNSTTALSMLLIGSLLAEPGQNPFHADRSLLHFTVLRLLVIPLASFLICRMIGIDPVITGAGVILAAMPGGSTTVILASKYGSDTAYASKLVVFSTLLSLLSIPLWGMVL
ncbi:MAG TPA: AEC family transporter [Sphaerochaeta sp.]|nr:AEC family transporter [Sphaerochaeta sp.]HPY44470.1 AEC family transporter [Sphaerochaeta sp.]HQB05302.1 AEC family transporter [Sphaerochaeta sp.]